MPPARTTSVPQAYVTTASLVIVTAFRAALIASIGICYTQLLWATFRRQTLKIHVIEDLFQVQNNALRLTNYRLYLRSRLVVLTIIAVFCWLVPIATIYPPGALIVGSQALTYATSFNVPTLNRNLPAQGNEPRLDATFCQQNGNYTWSEIMQNATIQKNCYHRDRDINDPVKYITTLSLISGDLARLYQPRATNSSYTLNFWGTKLECETRNITLNHYIQASEQSFEQDLWLYLGRLNGGNDPNFEVGKSAITYDRFQPTEKSRSGNFFDLNYYPCTRNAEELRTQGVHVLHKMTRTTCRPKMVRYHVTVTFLGSIQHVSYTLSEETQPPEWSTRFRDFKGDFAQWIQFSEVMAIYIDFANRLNSSDALAVSINAEYLTGRSQTGDPYKLPNGSEVETCRSRAVNAEVRYPMPVGLWGSSVFARRLRNSTTTRYSEINVTYFDPDMANELLINTTISALSLNKRFSSVNGTETRAFNIYRFQHKLGFFLPYGLCLGLAIPMLVLGFIALYVQNNGTSAMGGGFLQLLMTTTGSAAVEAALAKGSGTLGGYENVSKELKEMELRYGELVEDDGVKPDSPEVHRERNDENAMQNRTAMMDEEESLSVFLRAGFGTDDEVTPLRRRKALQRGQGDNDT